MTTPTTPERAHIEALKREIRRAENSHAATRIEASYAKSELAASEAALEVEHQKRKKAEADLAAFSSEWTSALEERDAARKSRDEARAERDSNLESLKATSDALTAVVSELDRVLSGGLVLKTPGEAVEFAKRVRALAIPLAKARRERGR